MQARSARLQVGCIAVCCALGAVAGFLAPGLDIGVGIAIGAGVGVAGSATNKTTKGRRCDQADRHPDPKGEHS